MPDYFQDDARESEMIKLFSLIKDETEGRSGVDAYLELEGKKIPFELKTTSRGSVTTVRDFGPDHIEKWKGKHWLIAFFKGKDVFYKYGSPDMMKGWIDEKEEYIRPDFQLAQLASSKLNINDMFLVCEEKEVYEYNDAKRIQKMQYKKEEYLNMQDLPNGYSPEKMLSIIQDRTKYLIERGSTLNNPHIPESYFDGWEEIRKNHAKRLRELVLQYFKQYK